MIFYKNKGSENIMKKYTISVKGVTKCFKAQTVFENINVDFQSGNIYGIVGENGAGKTLFFKIICGFAIPTAGEIFVYGEKLDRRNCFPRDTGIVIERSGFIDNYTARNNLEYLTLLNKKVCDKAIEQALQMVGLNPFSKKKYKNFSLGMKQKLAIAQAIFEDPKILILDEPFNSLDEESTNNIKQILLNLRNKGKLILLATHNRYEIQELCNVVYKFREYSLKEVNV